MRDFRDCYERRWIVRRHDLQHANRRHAFQVLHNFSTLGGDGYQPRSELIVLGSQLYGTTELGGVFETPKNPGGTAFRLNLDGTGYERIHSFGGSV